MQTFISEIAGSLYDRYGDGISDLTLVFPSRRARLFFSDAMAHIASRPVWQPRFVTIGKLMEQVAGVETGEHIRLLTELYKVYSHYHDEPFDAFYFWGEILLADYDQIDKYLVDADMLFSNIDDLHRLDDRFGGLSPEQISAVRRFWGHFAQGKTSQEREKFLRIWNTLGPIYHEFRGSLSEQNLAYEGMVHRLAAEKLRSGAAVPFDTTSRYVVAGFNALSACEKRLFAWMQRTGTTEFYWDYDRYYVENPDHEAGLFLRGNIHAYPMPSGVVGDDHFAAEKELVAVASPSDSLQCKYVYTFLQALIDRGLTPGKETAVVLTDESLLLPVLYSIPEGIRAVNVTMGYPLRQTTAYSFVERLIELQARKQMRGGAPHFYHSDVSGLLSHPYVLEQNADAADGVTAALRRTARLYVPADLFHIPGLVSAIFRPVNGWRELTVWLREILSAVGSFDSAAEDEERRREFFSLMTDRLSQVETTLAESGLEVTESLFASLLRKILQKERVPYEGEPLEGIQVMGILETRNLDFENLLILSVNDDTFPGNRAIASSFVPHNLRLAYALLTPAHHEGVYAYYFYRLLQRARRIHMVYCSRSDERCTGEPSRYIYQLDFESPHALIQKNIPLSVNLAPDRPVSVPKTGEVADRLKAYLASDGPMLSPTSFYAFVECPLKFYFRNIAGLRVEEMVTEEIDLPMFGTLLHKTMEILYRPLEGVADPAPVIGRITTEAIRAAVEESLHWEYFRGTEVDPKDYGGSVLLARDTVVRYLDTCLLPYDARHGGFEIRKLEERVKCRFDFLRKGIRAAITFGGLCDRIDTLPGGVARIVDYKTGGKPNLFGNIDDLFAPEYKLRRPAAFQTLLYSLILNRMTGESVQPALYYVREMNKPDYSPLLETKAGPISRYSTHAEGYEGRLREALGRLFDLSVPFEQCRDHDTCTLCDYRDVCRR